jgi:hypothetical protein
MKHEINGFWTLVMVGLLAHALIIVLAVEHW